MKPISSVKLLRRAIIGSSIALMLPGAWGNSVTIVELAHLPSGIAAWQEHSLGIYNVCGPVSKWLYSLPAYLAGIKVSYKPEFNKYSTHRHEWEIGRIFQSQHRRTCQAIYRWSRLLPILVTILGGCLACEWSTRLFGAWPGTVSLGVWCWMPPVLAHGALVTSDIASAVLTLLAARTFWAFLLRPCATTMLASGAALGLAQATKFTLLILDPCWAALLLCRMIQLRLRMSRSPSGSNSKLVNCNVACRPLPSTARFLALCLGLFIISVIVIDSSYGFWGIGISLKNWDFGQSSFANEVREISKSSYMNWLNCVPMPIPIELLRGLDAQLADAERLQPAYLLGQTRLGGWWYWYAVAAIINIPIPAIIIWVISVLRARASIRGDDLFWACLCLLVPAAEIFAAISMTTGTGTNAAFRYLLPSLALLCVWGGVAFHNPFVTGNLVAAALLIWLLLGAIGAAPNHLSSKNEIGWIADRCIGKPPLIGDSLDWGQDLLRLGDWVAGHSEHGSTVACVYSLGVGEPFGLKDPAARSNWNGASFVAVSENILFDYEPSVCVSIGNCRISLGVEQRKVLQNIPPIALVGRTIRIYRYGDLPARLFRD